MAYQNLLLVVFALLAAVVIPTTLAKEFIAGDELGWTVGFDYQAWAQGKQFFVGDKLVFKYPVGAHNVFRVNGNGFQNCVVPPPSEALSTGNDAIVLATPGRKWYICGVGKHCEIGGQKLFITVQLPTPAPSPSIAPSPLKAEPQYSSFSPTTAPSSSPSSVYQTMSYTSKGAKDTISQLWFLWLIVAIVSVFHG